MQLAYAIGVAEPVSIRVDTSGTGTVSEDRLAAAVRKVFDCRPRALVEQLDLLRPLYAKTAAYGHFGRKDLDLPWEDVSAIASSLKQATASRVTAVPGG